MQNIGVTFIKTGQYSDAINSFEHIMSVAPNLKAGFNLILSYFAVGDREKMKKAFQKLIAVPLETDEDGKYISPNVSMKKTIMQPAPNYLCFSVSRNEKVGVDDVSGFFQPCINVFYHFHLLFKLG